MATFVVLSVYDNKVGMFNVPFMVPHIEVGFRSLRDLVNDLGTTLGRHPSDFTLWHLGTFDDQRGVYTQEQQVNLGPLTQFLNQPAPGGLFASQPTTKQE